MILYDLLMATAATEVSVNLYLRYSTILLLLFMFYYYYYYYYYDFTWILSSAQKSYILL